ncbi:phosphate ABC transporter permease PstA [Rubrivirga marina]|uniref:Phosphate transport system permease protein PstA n=1 Tax=Rubrivirga marina TaxID=1196024 RepID=A0A271J174_9BACT|nr:phosphate ABC transporter permease PstA [Rubrivirga marina]PAP77110.1 phosphate ABC transporter, permease protein PstA [Rubrivirga marina]
MSAFDLTVPSPALARRRRRGGVLRGLSLAAVVVGLGTLVALLGQVLVEGIPWLSADLLFEYPSRIAERAGLKAALAGTFWLMLVTAAVAVPIGVGAAVYLEEYARPGRFLDLVTINIANLAGVPSVIYGVLGLAVFVRVLGFGASFVAGGITLALLVLPVIVIATQEALRAIPKGVRESAYALGATRWQVVRAHLLPLAAPGALTGIILALSRAIGETAPILVVGAATFLAFLPATPLDAFSALPVQIYNWASRPQDEFRGLAAAGILVLLAVLLVLNGLAIWLRDRAESRTAR